MKERISLTLLQYWFFMIYLFINQTIKYNPHLVISWYTESSGNILLFIGVVMYTFNCPTGRIIQVSE